MSMRNTTTVALFFLAAGVFTSVSILSVYQVLFVVPLFYFTVMALKKREEKLPASAWWLLAFTVVALLSLVINFPLIPKPTKNFGRLKYFLSGVGGIFVFRLWLNEASEKTKRILLNTFFVSMMVAGLASVYTVFFLKEPRAKGLTETMRYGYGSAMILASLFSAHLHRDKFRNLLDLRWSVPATLLALTGMYLTMTRGALLGLLCSVPFILYFYRPKLGYFTGAVTLLLVLGLGGMYLFGSYTSAGQLPFKTRFLLNKNNESDVMRRSQWKSALIAIQERPVLGWGLSNFHSQLPRIKETYDLDYKSYNDAHSHNLFLEIASGTGLIGLVLFLGWLITWGLEIFRGSPLLRSIVIPFGVVFVVGSQFEVTLDANNASMIFTLYALSMVLAKKRQA